MSGFPGFLKSKAVSVGQISKKLELKNARAPNKTVIWTGKLQKEIRVRKQLLCKMMVISSCMIKMGMRNGI